MVATVDTSIKIIKLMNHPIKLAHFDETTWVALRSLASFLNLDYENQARTLAGNTTMAKLGTTKVDANAKMITDQDGMTDLWIPNGEVSLWASKLIMEDLTKLDRQNLCATLLPSLMSNAF